MSETTFYGTGRRKRSVARVYLSPGKGDIKVNGESFRDYLCRDSLATIVMQPLVAVEGEKAFDIEINVNGGGLTGVQILPDDEIEIIEREEDNCCDRIVGDCGFICICIGFIGLLLTVTGYSLNV